MSYYEDNESPVVGGGGGSAAADAAGSSSIASRLQTFSQLYAGVHGYVSIVVCLLGVVSNTFIVVVLTRRQMVNPTSRILTALAVSDLLTMLSYVPFALHFYIVHRPAAIHETQRNSVGWMRFFLVHVHLSVTAHTISIWLGVLLSVYRYSYVREPGDGTPASGGCQPNAVGFAIVVIYVCSIMAMIPNYMSLKLIRIVDVNDANDAGSVIETSFDFSVTNATLRQASNSVSCKTPVYYDVVNVDHQGDDVSGAVITRLNFWIHAVLVKLLPCALMSIFGLLIVFAVQSTHRKGSLLRKSSTRTHTATIRRRESHRTTSMLIAVIVLFLLTELPQGVLALLSGILDGFFETYYTPLGDLMDIVALTNNGINFTLYCTMSNKFRRTFLSLFCHGCCCCCCSDQNNRQTIGREIIVLRTIMLTAINAHGSGRDQR